VEQFSEDIRRYLEGRPVMARRDTFAYRAGKFLRRNAAVVTAMTAAIVLLLATSIGSMIAARRDQLRLRELERRELALGPSLVSAYNRLGDLYGPGDAEQAKAAYRRAADGARDFLATHPDRVEVRADLGWALLRFGELAPAEALAAFREALQVFEAILQSDPHNAELQQAVVLAARRLGGAQFAAADRLAALASFSRALQVAEGFPASVDARRAVAECNFEVGEVLARNGTEEAAVAKLRKALEVYRELVPKAPRLATDGTAASFVNAIAAIAPAAPTELRAAMEAELQRWR
jgi:tetratricopeptide (TPR) repeat protein